MSEHKKALLDKFYRKIMSDMEPHEIKEIKMAAIAALQQWGYSDPFKIIIWCYSESHQHVIFCNARERVFSLHVKADGSTRLKQETYDDEWFDYRKNQLRRFMIALAETWKDNSNPSLTISSEDMNDVKPNTEYLKRYLDAIGIKETKLQILDLLKMKNFVAYLQSFLPDEEVGLSDDIAECPITKYLINSDIVDVLVVYEWNPKDTCIVRAESPAKFYQKEFEVLLPQDQVPDWVKIFIAETEDSVGEITAQDALVIIENISDWQSWKKVFGKS